MKEEWLFPGAVVPVDVATTAALVNEIKRLIGMIGKEKLAAAERERLAQPEQGPVMWERHADGKIGPYTPPRREWVGLTEVEALGCFDPNPGVHSKKVEAKLKEKNA